MPVRSLAKRPSFPVGRRVAWLLVVIFALVGTVYYGLTAWLPDAYAEQGWSQAETGWLSAVLNIATVPASLLVSITGHRVSRRTGLVASASLMVAATLLLLLLPDGGYAWAALAGFANGALFAYIMTLPLDVADSPADVGATVGMMLGFGYGAVSLAPVLLGAVRDLTDSFDGVLLAVVLTAVALLAAVALLSPARLERGVRPLGERSLGAIP